MCEQRHCDCFGDSGLHASTHRTEQGLCCDMCGWPVQPGSTDVLTAINAEPALKSDKPK